MSNLLERGASWLAAKLKASASRTVIYRRGAEFVEVSAVIGKTEYGEGETQDAVITHRMRDYLVLTADLLVGGRAILPEIGDRIEETASGKTHVHEVLATPSGEVYRYADPFRIQLRIHTKEIAVVDA